MIKKRKYYRKCAICGERHEQNDMVKMDDGWLCLFCFNIEHPEYDIEEW